MKTKLTLILLLAPLLGIFAQNVNINTTMANAEITTDGMDEFYEVDVLVSTTGTPYKLQNCLLYFDYNTAAFGNQVVANGNLTYEQPAANYIGGNISTFGFPSYTSFTKNDNLPTRFAVSFQQAAAPNAITAEINSTPQLLLHLKIKYLDSSLDPMICLQFDGVFDDQYNTACGSTNGFFPDCTTFPGINLTDDTYDCSGAALPVSCAGGTTTWETTTGWDNNAPDSTMTAIINGVYNTSTANLDVCELIINANGTLTVGAGEYVSVENNISVAGNLQVNHTGSIVQIDDDATVLNTGSINVELITPNLDPRDFMVIGSPMTTETRESSFGAGFRMLSHSTLAFDPHPDVQMAFPDGQNFVDADNNDWSNHSGLVNPGEGYLYWAAPNLQTGGIYTINYTSGTLSNGVITYNTTFGDDANDSPNIIANPYPSAIDADVLIANNDAIDEVYFWEHNTEPNNTFPGANSANFNMEDISVYNDLGGVASSTGGTTPNGIISTGQGFGIKAATGDAVVFDNSMRVTTGNTTLRNSLTDVNRIWLNATSVDYELSSSMLVGFTEFASNGYDTSFDSKRLSTIVSLYSRIDGADNGYTIQGRAPFDVNDSVSIGFSTLIEQDNGAYRISLSNFEGAAIENATIYLVDNYTGIQTLLNDSDYLFNSSQGNFPDRFTIVFQNEVLNINDLNPNIIRVFPNPTDGKFTVTTNSSTIKTVIIRDVLGRTIDTLKNINQDSVTVDMSVEAVGVYFVSVITDRGQLMKRIIKE